MSALRNTLDRLKPTFSKGGKLSALGSFFDAMETFFFVPKSVTRRGTHIKDSVDLKRTMITVMVGSYSLNRSIVRHSIGCPPTCINCFGSVEPIRVPLPPATMITARFMPGVRLRFFLTLFR